MAPKAFIKLRVDSMPMPYHDCKVHTIYLFGFGIGASICVELLQFLDLLRVRHHRRRRLVAAVVFPFGQYQVFYILTVIFGSFFFRLFESFWAHISSSFADKTGERVPSYTGVFYFNLLVDSCLLLVSPFYSDIFH